MRRLIHRLPHAFLVLLLLPVLALGCSTGDGGDSDGGDSDGPGTGEAAEPAVEPSPAGGPVASPSPPTGHFLTLSDIHFDPFYDPSLMERLKATPASGWKAIFDSSSVTTFRTDEALYKQDTNYPLFRSTLQSVTTRLQSKPIDYVIITGDFMGHDFPKKYKALNPSDDTAAYRQFVRKTQEFLALELAAVANGVPIYPAIGNNDAYCGDYGLCDGSGFMEDLAAVWQPLVGQPLGKFSRLGSYTVPHPTVPGLTLAVINNVPFAKSYPRTSAYDDPTEPCDASTTDLLSDVQSWLDGVLAAATGRVILAAHVPPGVDQYSTVDDDGDGSSAFTCPVTPSMSFNDAGVPAMNTVLDSHASKIALFFAAHTHMDDFRVFQVGAEGARTPLLVHYNPSVSIHNQNNPGFQLFTYDPADGTLLDYETHYLANLDTAGTDDGQGGTVAADWQPLYTFSVDYIQAGGLPAGAYDATAVTGLIDKLGSDTAFAQGTYWQFHALRGGETGAGVVNADDWPIYHCTLGNLRAEEFSACVCPSGS